MSVRKWHCAAILAVSFATTPSVRAEYETVAHGVANYGGSGECPGDDVWYVCCGFASYLGQWWNSFDSWGYVDNARSTNKEVSKGDWNDSSSDHVEPSGTDWADAIFYVGHGNRSCAPSTNYYVSYITMGDDGGNPVANCNVALGSSMGTNIVLGNGGTGEEANILVAKACHAAQLCVWQAGVLNSLRAPGTTEFNMFNGHHGLGIVSPNDVSEFDTYLDNAESSGIGWLWVIKMTDMPPIFTDTCGVSIVWAASPADADDHFFDSGFKDFHNTGSGFTYYYGLDGCDPEDGEEL